MIRAIIEDLEYTRRLMRAGVPTESHLYPGAYRRFKLAPEAKASQAYTRDHLSARPAYS